MGKNTKHASPYPEQAIKSVEPDPVPLNAPQRSRPLLPPVIGAAVIPDENKPCPHCGRPYLSGHPDNVLLWDHDDREQPCATRDYVDSRAAADTQLMAQGYDRRYATEQELSLMKYVGRDNGPETIVILVDHGVYRYQEN